MTVIRKSPGRPRKDSASLDVATIVTAAWDLVNREGLDALSTRTLAAALGVQSPALYWHVKSKNDLLSLMAAHVLDQAFPPFAPGQDWQLWFRDFAVSDRAMLLRYRDSGRVLAMAAPAEATRVRLMPILTDRLRDIGLSDREASAVIGGLASLIFGWVAFDQNNEVRSYMDTIVDSDAGFALAVDTYVRGVAALVADR